MANAKKNAKSTKKSTTKKSTSKKKTTTPKKKVTPKAKPKKATTGKRTTKKATAPKVTKKPSTKKSTGKTKAKSPTRAKKTTGTKSKSKQTKTPTKKSTKKEETFTKKVGSVYRGVTKYIDPDTKKERNYVVVLDNGKRVSVAKLKSIKIFDAQGKNADKALVEINAKRYGLEKRTGVDFQVFDKNRMSGKNLNLKDLKVFPDGKERFILGSHDKSRVLRHTKKK